MGLKTGKNLNILLLLLFFSLLLTLLLGVVSQFVLNQSAQNHIQAEGKRLARTAARLAISEDDIGIQKWAQSILALDDISSFAYFVLTDASGTPLVKTARQDGSIPAFITPDNPALWYSERSVVMPSGSRVHEFTAPVLNGEGDLEYLVAVGFLGPEFSLQDRAKPILFLFLVSFIFVSILHLALTKVRPGVSGKFLTHLKTMLEGTAGETELESPIPGASGKKAEQIRAMLVDYWKNLKRIEAENSDLQITQKVSLYTKNRFEAIFEEFPDGIMLMDESAVVTYANSKIEIFLGKPKEQIVKHKFHDWCTEETLTDFFARFQNVQNRLHRKKELLFSPAHLADRTLSIGAYPVDNRETNTFIGTLILCRDVTAEALAKQARGDFVAHVSHELKSPLNVLKMYSELLLGEEGGEEEIRRDVANVISDEAERLSLLINNLLSISKIEMGSIGLERQRVKMLDLLTDAFHTISRTGKGEELELKLELPHELSHLSLDKDLFRVALNNLLTNAIKYNRPHGSVTLSAEETDSQIIIQVKDTGLGISQEDQEKIFEKFFRSDNDAVREKPGHGLGLSLAKNIIEVHHGKLELESVLGEGSTFSIIFEKGAGLVQEGL